MSMFRILGQQVVNGQKVGGVLMAGEYVPGVWDVSVFEANGHRETSARQAVVWHEVADWNPYLDAIGNPLEPQELTEKELAALAEEKRLRSLKKSAQRAQTQCRRAIKSSGFDELLTITYRENQQDRELCKKHFKEWVRRMKRALPDFQYCAGFEAQDRGAMHVHLATHRLPKHAMYQGVKIEAWKLGTKVWRSIVGEDNGLVFVGGKSKWGMGRHRKMSLAKMAAYVSKYIMKDFEKSPVGSNRYSRSDNIELPPVQHVRLEGCGLREAIETIFQCDGGDVIVSHRVGRFGDSYWLCTEPVV